MARAKAPPLAVVRMLSCVACTTQVMLGVAECVLTWVLSSLSVWLPTLAYAQTVRSPPPRSSESTRATHEPSDCFAAATHMVLEALDTSRETFQDWA